MKTILLTVFAFLFINTQAQTLNSVTPDFGDIGQTVPVTITGSNTNFTSGSVYFSFLQGSSTLPFNNVNYVNNTNANGSIDLNYVQQGTSYNPPSGFFDLRYTFFQGTAVHNYLNDAFFVNASLNGTFTISGTIIQGTPKMDAAGDPVVYSKIFLESTTQEVLKIGRTDANGFISFQDIPAGTYYLHIDNHNNSNPLMINVGQNHETSNLSLEFKNSNLVNGINNIFEQEYDLEVYPTVFDNKLLVTMNFKNSEDLDLSIVDLNGRTIVSKFYKNQIGKVEFLLDEEISSFSTGVFFLNLRLGNEMKSIKILKK